MKNRTAIGLLTAALLVPAASVSFHANAKEVKSEKQAKNVILFRKSIYQLVRANMGPLGAMAKGRMPYDDKVIEKNATRMAQLAAMIPDYMAADTSKFNDGSDAKAEIWQNMNDFNAKAEDLYVAARALQDLAAEGQTQDYKKAIGRIGATCKACHDDYKAE